VKLSEPAKKMILVIGIASLVLMAAGIVIYRSFSAVPFAIGVAIMAMLNCFKVYMVERTVTRTLDFDEKADGKNFVRFQYLARFLLTGAVLVPIALLTADSLVWSAMLWGSLAGVFTFQVAAYSVSLMKFKDDNVSAEKEGG
jgi:uncharacterized membrane protein YjgN (DUF898 family)